MHFSPSVGDYSSFWKLSVPNLSQRLIFCISHLLANLTFDYTMCVHVHIKLPWFPPWIQVHKNPIHSFFCCSHFQRKRRKKTLQTEKILLQSPVLKIWTQFGSGSYLTVSFLRRHKQRNGPSDRCPLVCDGWERQTGKESDQRGHGRSDLLVLPSFIQYTFWKINIRDNKSRL